MEFTRTKLSECCQIKPPKSEAKKALSEHDLVSFVPMKNLSIDSKALLHDSIRKLSEVSGSYTYFAENDVLLAKITPCFENGKLGIAKELKNGIGFGSSEFIVFRPEKKLLPEYLYYFLLRPSFRDDGKKVMTGAVGHKRVPKYFIENTKIPLPPINEQKRIVAILDLTFSDIEKARDYAEQNLKNARELFESYLQQVFSQRGDGWGTEQLENLSTLITKGSSPKWQGINYIETPEVLFVTSENVGINKMLYKKIKFVEEAFNEKSKKSILKKGDVLTNIVGASIGRTAVFDRDDLANINQAVCLIRCNTTLLSNEYLAYLLNSPYLIQILHDNEVNNARANLSLTFFRKLEVPSPSLKEQTKIVAKLKALSSEIKQLEGVYQNKLNTLDELKISTLQKAFTGELTKEATT